MFYKYSENIFFKIYINTLKFNKTIKKFIKSLKI